MYKIWFKLYTNDRVTLSTLYTCNDDLNKDSFRQSIYNFCDKSDIPAPVILPKHYNYFDNFNYTKFTTSDFIESVDFDYMTLEWAKSTKH